MSRRDLLTANRLAFIANAALAEVGAPQSVTVEPCGSLCSDDPRPHALRAVTLAMIGVHGPDHPARCYVCGLAAGNGANVPDCATALEVLRGYRCGRVMA